MRNLVLMSCAVLLFGCTSSDSPVAPPSYSVLPPGNLLINLNISGDPSTGPSSYPTTLDSFVWENLNLGENRFLVAAGTHTVALATSVSSSFFSSEYQSWCTATSPNRYSGIIAADVITTVTFSLDCPPLVGNGTLTLSFTVSGGGAPTEIPVKLLRLNGPTLSSSLSVPSNKPITVTLPVGLYRISTNGSGSCKPSNTFVYLGMPVRAVREGTSSVMNFPLTCT